MHKNIPVIFTLFLLIGIPQIIADDKPDNAGLLDLASIKSKVDISDQTPADLIAQQIYGMNFLPIIKLALAEPDNSIFALSGDASQDIEKESFIQLRTLYLTSRNIPGGIAEKANAPLNSPVGLIFAEVPQNPNRQSSPVAASKSPTPFDYKSELLKRRFRIPPRSIAKTADSWVLNGQDGKQFYSRLHGSLEPGSLVLVGLFVSTGKEVTDLIFPDEYLTERMPHSTPLPQSLDKIAQTLGVELAAVSSYRRGLTKKELAYEGSLGAEDHLNEGQRNLIQAIDKIRKSKPSPLAYIDQFQEIRPESFWLASLWLELTTKYPAETIQFCSITRNGTTQWIALASGKIVFSVISPEKTIYGDLLYVRKFKTEDGEPKIEWFLSNQGALAIWTRVNEKRLLKPSGEETDISEKSKSVIDSYLIKNHFGSLKENFPISDSADFQVPTTFAESNPVLLPSAITNPRVPSLIRSSGSYMLITADLGNEGGIVTYAFEKSFYYERLEAQFKAWRELAKMRGDAQERVNEEIRKINRAYLIHGLRQEGYLP